jgi:general secretion pathway protein J
MRMSEELLRSELTVAFPFRWKKMQNQPLAFTGAADSLRFAAPLVSHVGQGGLFWMQLSLQDAGDTHRLVLSRAVPDADATSYPEFAEEDKTILADDIAELKFSYFGPQSDMIDPATQKPSDRAWQDQWVDRRTLPLLVSIEVKPRIGAPWPRLVIEPKMNSSAGCTWDDFHKQCVYV